MLANEDGLARLTTKRAASVSLIPLKTPRILLPGRAASNWL